MAQCSDLDRGDREAKRPADAGAQTTEISVHRGEDVAMEGEGRSELVQQFCAVTGETPERAEFFLESGRWDLETAINAFYGQKGEEEIQRPMEQAEVPRGAPEGMPERGDGASGSRTRLPPTGNVRGFADLGGQASSEDEEQMEWFTGGEKRWVDALESCVLLQSRSSGDGWKA